MKRCSKCGHTKPVTEFHKAKPRKDGLCGHCKECARIAHKAWRARNAERWSALRADWNRRNPGRVTAHRAKHKHAKVRAIPGWADMGAIASIYAHAKDIGMDVDHVVPLQGGIVCGLHVENNLQLLTPADNKSKGNRLWPDRP